MCGDDQVWHQVQQDTLPVSVAQNCWNSFLQGAGGDLAKGVPDPNFNPLAISSYACSAVDALLSCLTTLSDCSKGIINFICGTAVGGLTGGLEGAAVGAAGGLGSLLSCICITFDPSSVTVDDLGGKDWTGFDGGGPGSLGDPYFDPIGFEIPSGNCTPGQTSSASAAATNLGPSVVDVTAASQTGSTSVASTTTSSNSTADASADLGIRLELEYARARVWPPAQPALVPSQRPSPIPCRVFCAQVRIRLDQELAITRAAFLGTLEIDNGETTDSLTGIKVDLEITDDSANHNPVNSLFGITGPQLSGLTAVDGTGQVAPGATGTAQFTFIPTDQAAVNGPTEYHIGGRSPTSTTARP